MGQLLSGTVFRRDRRQLDADVLFHHVALQRVEAQAGEKPAQLPIAAPQAQIVLLVKPQFEVGKGNLGKNGIVESQELREQALSSVVACAERNGLDVRATTVSPIEGTHGNIEYLLYAVMQ